MTMYIVAQSTTNSSTALWFTLVGALGGVLLTGLFALATAIVNHRWQEETVRRQANEERHRQYRQERKEAYAEYMLTYGTNYLNIQRLDREVRKRKKAQQTVEQRDPELNKIIVADDDRWRAADASAQIVASKAVLDALRPLRLAIRDARQAAWNGEFHANDDFGNKVSNAYVDLLKAMRADLSGSTEADQ
jgi:hypothetical protein